MGRAALRHGATWTPPGLREPPPPGRIAVLGDRDYFRAFAAWMRDPIAGEHERREPAESEAA